MRKKRIGVFFLTFFYFALENGKKWNILE